MCILNHSICLHRSKVKVIFVMRLFFNVFSISSVQFSCSVMSDSLRPCRLPGSVHGILQARILEWVTISFSKGSSWPRDRTRVSRIVDRHFTVWATREVQFYDSRLYLRDTWFFLLFPCREPARGVPPVAKVMRLRGPTGKGESGLKGASLDLLMHLPPNQSLPALLCYAFHLLFWH